jgi:cobalt/nickel transport system ATP-binding protein
MVSPVLNNIRLKVKINKFSYDENNTILKNIEITVQNKEVIAIVGKNGSGKTTLLKIMAGFLKDFDGEVWLDGINIKKLSSKQIYSKMGLFFQDPEEQLFSYTVFDEVAFGVYNLGYNDIEVENRVKSALLAVGLEGFEERPISALSFGQKRRLCIACLLSMGHELLLLDEPTAGIDPEGQREVVHLIKKLNSENHITFIISTHDVDLIPLLAKKIYVLYKGEIVKKGPPEEVFLAKDVEKFGLRLPYVAELIYSLKEKFDNIEKLPLTVKDAKEWILRKFTL